MNIKKWSTYSMKKLPPWTLGAVILALGLLSWLWENQKPPHTDPHPASADTYIPEGHVLLPIEVENYRALDQILGNFGVVDLYTATEGQGKSTLVAQGVKILRSPNSPEHLAVLVRDDLVNPILQNGTRFSVAVQSPEKTGTKIVNRKPARRRIIDLSEE